MGAEQSQPTPEERVPQPNPVCTESAARRDLPAPRSLFETAERSKYRYMLLRSFLQWIDTDSGCTALKEAKCPCYDVVARARLRMRALLTARPDPFAIDEYAGAQLRRALELESWMASLYTDGACLRSIDEDGDKHNFEFMLREWLDECRGL